MGPGPWPGDGGCFSGPFPNTSSSPAHPIKYPSFMIVGMLVGLLGSFFSQETEQLANRWTQTRLWVETMGDLLLHVFAPRSGGFV